ncbi:Asp23/Gls24 family envelope stress response protein [Micromonospora sp. CPCC 205539]|uniref:Asp23/Gls24 family envelope stress response protein n=1 Tax=Micromonospora sp. CPCC 205539 TaxID=3122408 RepID=UPI002FEE76A6
MTARSTATGPRAGHGPGTPVAVGAAEVARIAAEAAGRVPGVSSVRPATVRLDDRSVGLDLHLVTWYGHSVPAVAEAVRVAVADRLAAITGLVVAAVTVTVDDLLVPGVDAPRAGMPRPEGG